MSVTPTNETWPKNVESEKAVLGGIILDGSAAAVSKASAILTTGDFFLSDHSHIFWAMQQLAAQQKPIDTVSLMDVLERDGKLRLIDGGVPYISSLATDLPRFDHIEHHARMVKGAAIARGIAKAAAAIGNDAMRRNHHYESLAARWHTEDVELQKELECLRPGIDWSDPEPLGDDLPPVPPFDLKFLPASFRPFVADIAERMQVPPDLPGAASIVALAGCVNRRAYIYPKRADTLWVVVPNLWGATIASPGLLKSPVLAAIMKPLVDIEQMWRAEQGGQLRDFEIEKEKKHLAHQVFKEQWKKAKKDGQTEPPWCEPDTSLKPPVMRRLMVGDATPERLQEILLDNPAGILASHDELTGWISQMNKEGRETERSFYLTAWNGFGSFTVDRVAEGRSLFIPDVCVSLFGNIQPARVRPFLADALQGGVSDDGNIQRLQVLVWPDGSTKWELIDRPPDNQALARVEGIFSRLANLPTECVRLHFDDDAQGAFFAWWAELEQKVRAGVGMHPALIAHLSKYRSLMPSLAGLFSLADLIAIDPTFDFVFYGSSLKINVEHTEQAVALCAYLEAHARRLYSCIVSSQLHAARQLAEHLLLRDIPETFKQRDIYRRDWAFLGTPERVAAALAVLEEYGWVRKAEKNISSSPAGGRPPQIWRVNPKIYVIPKPVDKESLPERTAGDESEHQNVLGRFDF